jgi:hypothetical protein
LLLTNWLFEHAAAETVQAPTDPANIGMRTVFQRAGWAPVVALVKRERLAGRPPVTNGGVVAQVWRGGRGRQVPVARLLAGTEVVPVDDVLGRLAGMLLAASGSSDAVDAAVLQPTSDAPVPVTRWRPRTASTRPQTARVRLVLYSMLPGLVRADASMPCDPAETIGKLTPARTRHNGPPEFTRPWRVYGSPRSSVCSPSRR